MSRVYNHLRTKNPIPEFDSVVEFYDYVAVDDVTGRRIDGVQVNQQTGKVARATPLPKGARIDNHRYFYKGIPVSGSVTQMKYFDKFDADFHSRRIAYGERIFNDSAYKYYHANRSELDANWAALRAARDDKHLLYESVGQHYEEMAEWDGHSEHACNKAFRAVHDPFVQAAIIKAWERNRDEAGERGTAMHNTFQAYYEEPSGVDLTEARFKTPEFEQFLRFNQEWVRKKKLKPFRTELSMIDPETLISGTIDILYEVEGERKPGEPIPIVLADYKRTVDTSTTSFSGKDFGKHPFEDWQACKTSERWLQLLVYKRLFEKATNGRYRVVGAYIVCMHENNDEYIVMEVPLGKLSSDYNIEQRMDIVFNEQTKLKHDDLTNEAQSLVGKIAAVIEDAELVRKLKQRLGDVQTLLSGLVPVLATHTAKRARRTE